MFWHRQTGFGDFLDRGLCWCQFFVLVALQICRAAEKCNEQLCYAFDNQFRIFQYFLCGWKDFSSWKVVTITNRIRAYSALLHFSHMIAHCSDDVVLFRTTRRQHVLFRQHVMGMCVWSWPQNITLAARMCMSLWSCSIESVHVLWRARFAASLRHTYWNHDVGTVQVVR